MGRDGRVDNGLSDVGRVKRNIKDEGNVKFFKEIPEETKSFFGKVIIPVDCEGG